MTEANNNQNNDNDDLNEVKKHATQTFAAIERSFSRMAFRKRNTIRIIVCLLFFFLGYQANNLFRSGIPTEKIIEKIAAQPDLPNAKCKFRYDRPMEYAIMHECVFAHDVPTNETKLIQRINYCSCALERVQKKKPYQKMFENNLEDFTFKIREEILCKDEKIPPALEIESESSTAK